VHLVGCGTAMHAGMVGKTAIEALARVPAEVDIASEFRYRDPILKPEDLVIIISQSGETSDTLAALKLAKSRGVPVLAIVNVVGSSIARAADYVMYTYAGPRSRWRLPRPIWCSCACCTCLPCAWPMRAGS